jgi:hypothetical protein
MRSWTSSGFSRHANLPPSPLLYDLISQTVKAMVFALMKERAR